MTYLVSLISDHLLPNYLLIREMEGGYDELLFITTLKMLESGRGRRIERLLDMPENSVRRIVVSEEDLNEMLMTLKSEHFEKDDRFLVNMTCGTKIMSIGVYEFFNQFESSFYYIPYGKDKIENVRTSEKIQLNYRVNIEEYLTLYGIRCESDETFIYPIDETIKLFERFKRVNFNRNEIKEIQNNQFYDARSDSCYYSGAWFEEYCYWRIKNEKKLADDCIRKEVKLYRENSDNLNDNEIDVMYVVDNKLFVCECKVSMIGKPGSKSTTNKQLEYFMYKLAAICDDLGLNVPSYILTLHHLHKMAENSRKAMAKRQRILKIRGIIGSEGFKKEKLEI